jgi:hypothetical protein
MMFLYVRVVSRADKCMVPAHVPLRQTSAIHPGIINQMAIGGIVPVTTPTPARITCEWPPHSPIWLTWLRETARDTSSSAISTTVRPPWTGHACQGQTSPNWRVAGRGNIGVRSVCHVFPFSVVENKAPRSSSYSRSCRMPFISNGLCARKQDHRRTSNGCGDG